jgi:hypothetical protein
MGHATSDIKIRETNHELLQNGEEPYRPAPRSYSFYKAAYVLLFLQFYQSALTQRHERLYLSLAAPILGIKRGSLQTNTAVCLP